MPTLKFRRNFTLAKRTHFKRRCAKAKCERNTNRQHFSALRLEIVDASCHGLPRSLPENLNSVSLVRLLYETDRVMKISTQTVPPGFQVLGPTVTTEGLIAFIESSRSHVSKLYKVEERLLRAHPANTAHQRGWVSSGLLIWPRHHERVMLPVGGGRTKLSPLMWTRRPPSGPVRPPFPFTCLWVG